MEVSISKVITARAAIITAALKSLGIVRVMAIPAMWKGVIQNQQEKVLEWFPL